MDERFHEQAAQLDQDRRDAALRRVQAVMARPGQSHCDDCGEPIPAARRAAIPSVVRCIRCQEFSEGGRK